MEKHAQKAKITLTNTGEGLLLNRWKSLMFFATIIYVIAFFTPWIQEHYFFIMEPWLQPEIYPYPDVPREAWFWSFLTVIHTARNDYRILLFWDYWFNANSIPYSRWLSGWLGVFIFQILTILMALATIHQKIRLGTVLTTFSSIIAPILCIYQQLPRLSYDVDGCQFFIGFWLAVISSILFFVSCRFAGRQNKPSTDG